MPSGPNAPGSISSPAELKKIIRVTKLFPASTLRMDNVPWHEEVIEFVDQLSTRLPEYALACEHEHSNCILLAKKKFFIDDKWHTWIDYEKFVISIFSTI